MPTTPSPALCAEPAAAPAASVTSDAPQKTADPVLDGLNAKLQQLEAKKKQLDGLDERAQAKAGHDIKAVKQRLHLQITEIRTAMGANSEAAK